MPRDKLYFGLGLVFGLITAAVFLLIFAPRYATVQDGARLIKLDKWSGKSWRLVSAGWEEIKSVDSRQQQIDHELRQAMMVVIDQSRLKEAVAKFKEIFPNLKDVPDNELLDRMSALYSRQLTSALFLENYQRSLEEKAKAFLPPQPKK